MITPVFNEFGQPIGVPLPDWAPPPWPPPQGLEGRYCRLEVLDPATHVDSLYEANGPDADGGSWTYLAYGPFPTRENYRAWMSSNCAGADPLFFAILDKGKAVGLASYLRINPDSGSIEVGHIHYSRLLKRTRPATEAMYLMMKTAFELGYRRYEWKCDALNAASRAAAQRLGLSFEGSSGRRQCTMAATATPPGTPPAMPSGRHCAKRTRRGSTPVTLRLRAD